MKSLRASLVSQVNQLDSSNLLDRVDAFRLEANRRLDDRQKAELGQFMTPTSIANLMASMLKCELPKVSLLDAGAGVGSLLSAVVVMLCCRTQPPESIDITAYEIDPVMVGYLQETLHLCRQLCEQSGIIFNSKIIQADFIAHAVEQLATPLFEQHMPHYTCAILNPPYRKINSNSLVRQQLRKLGIETSNLYTGFIAIAIYLLSIDGELVAITPRSFCNGSYFRPFRELLLRQMSLRQIHLFSSRQASFFDDAVLQENIIISTIKTETPCQAVEISLSDDSQDEMPTIYKIPYNQVVHPKDSQKFIHLVLDESGVQAANRATTLSANLLDLGITISTGRVVEFRSRSYLRAESTDGTVPLVYPSHIRNNTISWPNHSSKKPNAIIYCDITSSLLVPNEYYVLVKRFSSKEERRRVVAAVYNPDRISSDFVGFENHLNYFHQNGHGLDRTLAYGLALFLNSTLVDIYFRQFNGHTQVNATDLRMLRYPSREELVKLGTLVGEKTLDQHDIDRLIMQECGVMSESTDLDPIMIKKKIDEALKILRDLGLPRRQQNERSALTLLAMLDLTPDTLWSSASDPLRGITPMMEFFAQYYGKRYKPNSRETVRRQTVHQFLDAGMLIANPDDAERPINSPKAVYQIESSTLKLLRTYGTESWQQHVQTYLASIKTLQQIYAQEREMQRIPIILPSGKTFGLSPGGQNILIKQIIDEFAARFVPQGEALYIGDTDEKFAYFAEERLRELGVAVDTHGKMPDVIIYYTKEQWLVRIEAVTSHGPIDPKRRRELAQLFQKAQVDLVYVTAFLTRSAMKEYISEISWETEVWVAEAPSHLIHFNGERFLGPYK